MDILKYMREAHELASNYKKTGKVATYIPELARSNADDLGICIITTDGQKYVYGDSNVQFTIQSISKLISFAVAIGEKGFNYIFSRVGMEPTGDPFNSIIRLETKNKPLNPMINAGAIAVVSYIDGDTSEEVFSKILTLTRKLSANPNITSNDAVYKSEKLTGDRNRSMAYYMKSENVMEGNVEKHLDAYFKMCSMSVTSEDLAHIAMILANDGIEPATGERLLEASTVKILRGFMITCGMYDESGEFSIKVGIPSKSGVGGGILSSVNKTMGIGVYGPSLNEKGNSIGGIKMLEYLSSELNLNIL